MLHSLFSWLFRKLFRCQLRFFFLFRQREIDRSSQWAFSYSPLMPISLEKDRLDQEIFLAIPFLESLYRMKEKESFAIARLSFFEIGFFVSE